MNVSQTSIEINVIQHLPVQLKRDCLGTFYLQEKTIRQVVSCVELVGGPVICRVDDSKCRRRNSIQYFAANNYRINLA